MTLSLRKVAAEEGEEVAPGHIVHHSRVHTAQEVLTAVAARPAATG